MQNVARARAALKRLIWGANEIGFMRTLAGLMRLVSLALWRRPRAKVITTANKFYIGFKYPAQLMPLLVIFQELLDPELAILHRLLGPGRVAVDVGASIGTWTLYAAETGAIVHALEPDLEHLAMLKENVRSNDLKSNVIAYDCALGADEGWSIIPERSRGYSINFRLESHMVQANRKRICTLDHFVCTVGIPYIDVLKINTAGCEADVLTGGRELFRQGKVGLAIILDGLAVRPLLDELKQFSYELGFYDKRKCEFISVDVSTHLDRLRPGPLNRYVLVKHSSVYLHDNFLIAA